MKKIIFILIALFISSLSFSDMASEKRIQVNGTSKKEILPNSAKISLVITTENKDLDKASKENSAILEKYKSLLKNANISYESIVSNDYYTSQDSYYERVVLNKGEKEFKTTLNIDTPVLSLNILQKFISTLAAENIYETKKNIDGSYTFRIVSQNKNAKEAYQNALNKFNNVKQKLLSNGVNIALNISGFKNDEVSLEKYENQKKETHRVSHSIEINTRDFKNLGKIIDLANVLNIRNSGYIEYDIDNKKSLENELYKTAYEEALKKAQTILGKTELNLRKPVTITDKSIDNIRPYTVSFYVKNYYYFIDEEDSTSNENILKQSNSSLIEKAGETNTIINPEKQTFFKTVYIEFEMN